MFESISPLNVLLVEDNTADAKLLTELLEANQFLGALHWVRDGADAMDFLLRCGPFEAAPRPDAVILDLNLPREDGRDFLAEMRRNPELRDLPVIVWTTSDRRQDRTNTLELGVREFHTKPRDLAGFEELAKRLSVDLQRLPRADPPR